MFAELIFVVLAIGGLLLIDNFSTSCALITCVLVIYYYVDYYPFVFNKFTFVLVASKVWAIISNCYGVGKRVYSLFQRFFFTHPESKSQSVSNNYCGDKANVEHEIKIFISKVSQHYIHSWYDKISSNEEFVSYLNSSINHTLVLLCSSISKIDKKKISYDVLQVYLNFLAHFVEAQKKAEAFKTDNFKMKHWAMKDRITEWCYSQSLVSTLLDSFCPTDYERSLHSKNSPVLHSVVVEILTESLIHPLVNLLCDPTRLNLLLLKVLLNYIHNPGDEIVPTNEEKNISIGEQPKSKPIILLPDHVVSDNYDEINSTKLTTENFLFVTSNSTLKTSQCVTENKNNKLTAPIFSAGIKSSSNINISDHNFHSDSGALDCDSFPPFACDTIKRSKSADFIRQIQPKSANPQLKALSERDYDIKLQSKSNKMFVTLKPDTSSHNSIEEAEEAVELEGQALFSDVKITDTYLQNETGLIPYTLYNIQYVGVFHDTGTSMEGARLVKEVTCVKRRFKEFVELHSKLEDSPLKNYIRGIRGPSKWLVLPFSNLDKKNIADRKIFLENYLKELCSSIPIAQSPELHEFLNYGDKHLYSRKSSDASVPRIDKILVRGVKSAIDMFKIVVPSDEDSVLSTEPVVDENIPDLKFQEHLLDFCSREPEIDEHARNFLENTSFQPFYDDNQSTETDLKRLKSAHLKNAGCCKCPTLPENRYTEDKHPLANTLFELIAVAFNLDETNPGDISTVMKLACFSMIKLLCAPNIERTIANKLDGISEEHITACFHLLHKFLWPEGSNLLQTKHSYEDGATLNKIMECFEAILSSEGSMKQVTFAVKNMLLEKINLFLSSLQYQETNKCLLYHVFDVIIENVLK